MVIVPEGMKCAMDGEPDDLVPQRNAVLGSLSSRRIDTYIDLCVEGAGGLFENKCQHVGRTSLMQKPRM